MEKIVGWDLDGTLIDTSELLKSTYRQMFGPSFKIDILASPYRNMKNNGYNPNQHWPRFWNMYRRNTSYAVLYDGVEEVLAELKDQGVTQVIISSLSDSIVPLLLTSTGIDHFFEMVVGGTITKFKKPNSYSIKSCIDKLNSDAKYFTFIGDSRKDKKLAENASVKFIHAGWNKYCSITSKYDISQPKDILELI